MARTSNLTDFLQDVADAIKTKREMTSSQKISAEDFDSEILSIETGTDTSDANAVAGDIIASKTAYVQGVKITGTIINNGALNYTPTTSTQTIPAGYTSGGTIGAAVIDAETYQDCLDLADNILGES